MKQFEVLLVDAANTIIHKPTFWTAFLNVLKKHHLQVALADLKRNHKLISELVDFPDVTSAEFYLDFNKEVLLSLGIIPTTSLLEELFEACSYLKWEAFEDVKVIKELNCPKIILSNFNTSLEHKIVALFGKEVFDDIITSEYEGIRKPNKAFYQRAIDIIGVEPKKILYIGDSLKLDYIPATNMGITAKLIDREGIYSYFSDRLDSFDQIKTLF